MRLFSIVPNRLLEVWLIRLSLWSLCTASEEDVFLADAYVYYLLPANGRRFTVIAIQAPVTRRPGRAWIVVLSIRMERGAP